MAAKQLVCLLSIELQLPGEVAKSTSSSLPRQPAGGCGGDLKRSEKERDKAE